MTRATLEHLAAPIESRMDRVDERRRKRLRHKGRSKRLAVTGVRS